MDELIQLASSGSEGIPIFPHEKIESFRNTLKLTPSDFFDYFARQVAHDYLSNKLSFIAADCAMNSLFHYCLAQYDVTLPSYAHDVYLAFDEGEFKHVEDDDLTDTEIKYTKPRIQSIVIRDVILGAVSHKS